MNSQLHKIKKLLSLIPLLHKNPGITTSALAKLAGLSGPGEVDRLLSSLLMLGRPPFSPGDYIDIIIENDGTLYLETAQGFDRPLQVNPAEWNALFSVTEHLRNFGLLNTEESENLYSILSRITSINFSSETAEWENKKRILEEAASENSCIEFTYKSLHSAEPELRQADPYAVFSHKGSAYLAAHCHQRRALRFFHLDRMENPEILNMERLTQPPEDLISVLLASPIFSRDETGYTVKIAFQKSAFNGLAFRLNLKNTAESDQPPFTDDWYTSEVKVRDTEWFLSLMRSFGTSVTIIEPAHLREKMAKHLKNIRIPDLISE